LFGEVEGWGDSGVVVGSKRKLVKGRGLGWRGFDRMLSVWAFFLPSLNNGLSSRPEFWAALWRYECEMEGEGVFGDWIFCIVCVCSGWHMLLYNI